MGLVRLEARKNNPNFECIQLTNPRSFPQSSLQSQLSKTYKCALPEYTSTFLTSTHTLFFLAPRSAGSVSHDPDLNKTIGYQPPKKRSLIMYQYPVLSDTLSLGGSVDFVCRIYVEPAACKL